MYIREYTLEDSIWSTVSLTLFFPGDHYLSEPQTVYFDRDSRPQACSSSYLELSTHKDELLCLPFMKVKTYKPEEKYSVNYKPSVDSSKMRFVKRLKDSRAVSTSRLSTCSISPPPSPLITMSISYKNHSTHKNPKLYNIGPSITLRK